MFFLSNQRIKYGLYKDLSSKDCNGHSQSMTLLKHGWNKKLMMRFWTNATENGWTCPSVVAHVYQQKHLV